MVAQVCDPSTREAETKESRVQGHLQLPPESEASLYCNKMKTTKKREIWASEAHPKTNTCGAEKRLWYSHGLKHQQPCKTASYRRIYHLSDGRVKTRFQQPNQQGPPAERHYLKKQSEEP